MVVVVVAGNRTLYARGGEGGSGCSNVRRSRTDCYGKPDGENGGRGGDVILECVWDFSESAETRALAESLSRDIIRGNPNIKWETIKGLENAKRLLKEAVVMPIKYPSTLMVYYLHGKEFFFLVHLVPER